MQRLPLIAPNPPRLSEQGDALRRIEASGVFSNNGPEVRRFEQEATERLFGGMGACVAISNATTGLMLAIRDAIGTPCVGAMALMPALTFPATAQAAWWAGLTPLICDVDAGDWSACAREEERLLRLYRGSIAALVPYATFGRAIDLDRYGWLAARHGVAVVVDAAASLGTRDAGGLGFGAAAPFPVVFSLHATKPFAVGEGGLVHCSDVATVERIRAMANFGFTAPRIATLPGLNAKLPEVTAVMAQARLATFDDAVAQRETLAAAYRKAIGERYTIQPAPAGTQALGFFPLLLPAGCDRARVIADLDASGIGAGAYFSPHLGGQPWVRSVAQLAPTPIADEIAARILSLPLSDTMTVADVRRVVATLDRVVHASHITPRSGPHAAPQRRDDVLETMIIGGGPAGTAMLAAASKAGLLPMIAAGLAVVERGPALGAGRLGGYAITSDSSADTFLTAFADHPDPAIAALADHPAARRVAAHRGALGVPLVEVGPLLDALGDCLARAVCTHSGEVLTRHRAVGARRGGEGLWHVTLACEASGATHVRRTRTLVIATGGHQPLDRLAAQQVGGAPLLTLAGGRLIQSDALLSLGGIDVIADLVDGVRAPRLAVVGGSTSAVTSVAALLKAPLALGAGALTLLHRRPLRPFYPSVEAAHAEGFTDFGPEDVCPVSGFVYRLAGFRLEARELVLRMLGVDGRAPDPRVATHQIAGAFDARARAIVGEADVVVAALGYRPHALRLSRADGSVLSLAASAGKPMVDRHCRVLDAAGRPLPGVFGIGLAAGFVPWGKLGGEASFTGQANGLWLWQNDVGMMIVEQLLARATPVAAIG